jgi:hypothetical protein
MIDVNQITSTLRGMPDQQLQQYAMMHKGDPYILSLAVSESNQRKKMRMAAQGQAGGMPQPKVADAAIAGMAQQQLPENQGIARIPTPNMQRMADGGIAGYEDDEEGMATGGMGGMFNFAQQSEPVVRMSGGGHIPRYQGVPTAMGGDGSLIKDIPGFQAVQPRDTFTQAGSPENMTPWERFSSYMGEKKKQATLLEIAYRIQTGIATPDEIVLYNSAKITGGDKAATDAKYPPQDAIRTKDFPGVKPGFEKMPVDMGAPTDKAPADKPPVPPVVNLPTSYKASKAPTIDDATTLGEKFSNTKKRVGDIERQVFQEQVDADRAKENSIEALRAFNEKQGPAYAGYEKLLQKEELQDATDKEKAGLMSLMKGFLAMAAGESPNAATNIAKGAMVGMGDYGDALKEFKKAAKERNKEMQNIEQARRSEERGDFKETRMYEDKADTARQASARFGIAAISEITNTGAKISADIYNNVASNTSRENIARMQEAAQNARLTAQLAAPDAQSKFYGNLGGGDPKKGLAYFAETMGPDAKGLQDRLKEYSGMVGEARLKSMETSKDPAERARAATIRQLQKEQMVGGIKPVNVAQDRNLLP